MNTTGMSFGLDGPSITGWWVNPTTGDKFNAVDTFFENNNLLIKTSDGRLLNYNQIQNYVQTNNPDQFKPNKSTQPAKQEAIPQSILNEIETVDESVPAVVNDLMIPEDDIYNTPKTQVVPRPTPTESTDDIIIRKALDKKSEPTIKVNIDWKKFPAREIEMLKDIMDVSIDDIINYYTNNLDMTDVLEGIKRELSDYILEKTQPTQEIKKTTTKKK